MDTVSEKIKNLLKDLNRGIYEKETPLALALLAAVAGESVFLLGPPGAAKSLISRRLKYAFKNGKVFEYLMNRFSTPEEIFGPVSISKLKNEDKYERLTANYLPDADIVFLDEIWKAGPSIQNALLTAINEKLFRNGERELKIPMKALISASNELPGRDEGLEALWDRFLVRLPVISVEDRDNFEKMIAESADLYSDPVCEKNKITPEEYAEWNKKIDIVVIPKNIFAVIHFIRQYLAEHNKKESSANNQIYVSDRRWRKIARLLRCSAFLNSRMEVDLMDCFLISFCIWNDKSQIEAAAQFVGAAIEKHGYTVEYDLSGLREKVMNFKSEINSETVYVKNLPVEVPVPVREDYYEITGFQNDNANLVKQEDFKNLTEKNQTVYLYYFDSYYKDLRIYSSFNLKKGSSPLTICINEKEYPLKTVSRIEEQRFFRKPDPALEKSWDEKVLLFLRRTAAMKEDIEKHRQKDLGHLRTNLFVQPGLADKVEFHIRETRNNIEKLEVILRDIRNSYKSLKEGEKVP